MKKLYLLFMTLLLTTLFYGQKVEESDSLKLSQDKTVNNAHEIEGLMLYPNPISNGKLFIITSRNSEKKVQIVDVLGNTVVSTKLKTKILDVSQLSSGIYILKILEEGKTATRKLVIK